MTTLVQLVNRVMVRLRESQVATATQSSYGALISRLVNDAKREVEEVHPWTALRTTATGSLTASATTCSFTGTNDRSRIFALYNTTEEETIRHYGREDIIRRRQTTNATNAKPEAWAFAGYSSGLLSVEIWPASDGAYTLTADCYVPQDDLADGDTLTIPDYPVYLRALTLAIMERGDDAGQTAAQAMREYEVALNDAVTRDIDLSETLHHNGGWRVY